MAVTEDVPASVGSNTETLGAFNSDGNVGGTPTGGAGPIFSPASSPMQQSPKTVGSRHNLFMPIAAHPTSAAADHVSEMARSESGADAITSRLRFGRLRRNADSTGKPVAAESP